MFRLHRSASWWGALAVVMMGSGGISAQTTATRAQDRVSTWVQAVSAKPENRLAPIPSPDENFTSFTLEPGVRVTLQAPKAPAADTLPHVILYLLPNGNTTEQAFGRAPEPGLDWHYEIQHIAAQTRRIRDLWTSRTVITAVVEADTLSWPAWRKAVDGADARIGQIVEEIRQRAGGPDATIDLVAHSGGGSFIWGYLNSQEKIPLHVEHIALLDANYSYSDEDRHGGKLLEWLNASANHRLIVIAYDDRRVTIDGKPIVSETGGTWRATDRMARRLEQDVTFTAGKLNDLHTSTALNGQILLARHPNPENKILHTVLVEMNGYVYSVLQSRSVLDTSDYPFSDVQAYRMQITGPCINEKCLHGAVVIY